MTGLMNWKQWRRRRQRKTSPGSCWQQQRHQLRKKKRQRVRVNVSDGGCGSVFTGLVYWQKRRRHCQSKTGLHTQRWQRMRQKRTRNRQCVWGIGDNDGYGNGLMTGPRNLRQQRRRQRRKISTETTTTTTDASVEDIQRVQGIGYDNRHGSGSTMVPADWQRQRSVDFPYYHVAYSNIVSSLSCRYLVLRLFSSDWFSFLITARKTISTAITRKYFCTKCTLTLCMYPLFTG